MALDRTSGHVTCLGRFERILAESGAISELKFSSCAHMTFNWSKVSSPTSPVKTAAVNGVTMYHSNPTSNYLVLRGIKRTHSGRVIAKQYKEIREQRCVSGNSKDKPKYKMLHLTERNKAGLLYPYLAMKWPCRHCQTRYCSTTKCHWRQTQV